MVDIDQSNDQPALDITEEESIKSLLSKPKERPTEPYMSGVKRIARGRAHFYREANVKKASIDERCYLPMGSEIPALLFSLLSDAASHMLNAC